MSRSFTNPPPFPYRRSLLDPVKIGEPVHFSCSRPQQNAAKHNTIKKRRAFDKRECRLAMEVV